MNTTNNQKQYENWNEFDTWIFPMVEEMIKEDMNEPPQKKTNSIDDKLPKGKGTNWDMHAENKIYGGNSGTRTNHTNQVKVNQSTTVKTGIKASYNGHIKFYYGT